MTKFAVRNFCNRERSREKGARQTLAAFRRINLTVVLFFLIVFAGFSYLYYINQTATGGFDIKGIENQITALEKQNVQLDLQAAELQSLSRLEEASASLDLVATTSIQYLPAQGSSVAAR
ncbi:MAG: hypothetical protein PHY34_02340 [Patescibacteria group bacterium]|nr:hypothetical protein [Patescibacteria group bacterium]MDD5715226.1 hypothetical protein [Patescibacteria group bacterium]